ncbi:MAG: signal peptide peptidase SppA [Acidilobaceae archaeon]|nr:signal peptide peptidase SppA [Acidilobaceae archaeon]MCX8165760.1 signal peptide peptidase SppA [Acidilobaceae archaeon]MDW7974185.1 signal peptide peptidase SppA [Sulfolobales archaeon]
MRDLYVAGAAVLLSVLIVLSAVATAQWVRAIEVSAQLAAQEYVALVELYGPIDYDTGDVFGTSGITPRKVERLVDKIIRDKAAKAVVLVVNSPGGTAASFEVYELIKRLSQERVVVVYFTDVGASGAYLMSLPADLLVAHPASLVGSVGAVAVLLNFKGLLDKLGINATTVTSGDLKDVGNPYRELKEEDVEYLREIVMSLAEVFFEKVREHRGDKIVNMREVMRAGVYPAGKAKQLGLVDLVGTLDAAVQKARELANLSSDVPVRRVEPDIDFFEIVSRFQPSMKIPKPSPLSVEILFMWPLPQAYEVVVIRPWD